LAQAGRHLVGQFVELPNDKNIVEAASDPRLRQAAGTLYAISARNIKRKYCQKKL
jgi:hypothetical protein